MKSRTFESQKQVFTSPIFIGAVLILVLNDFIFKAQFHNWFTGKLSDFAGVFAFGLFWMAIFPKHRIKALLLVGLFFIWWKSNLSDSFIAAWNELDLIYYSRIVDYTDLLALITLPIGYTISFERKFILQRQFLTLPSFLLACFAFMATSKPQTYIDVDRNYHFNFPKDTLISRLYKLETVNLYQNFHNTIIVDSSNKTYFNIYTLDTIEIYEFEGEIYYPHTSDSAYMEVYSDFCYRAFETNISVAEKGENNSTLRLFSIIHDCEEQESDKLKLITIFEEEVVENLE